MTNIREGVTMVGNTSTILGFICLILSYVFDAYIITNSRLFGVFIIWTHNEDSLASVGWIKLQQSC